MDLKEARELARQVGATITPEQDYFVVRLGVVKLRPDGGREDVRLIAPTPESAANTALLETGKAAKALYEQAKRVYASTDLIFGGVSNG